MKQSRLHENDSTALSCADLRGRRGAEAIGAARVAAEDGVGGARPQARLHVVAAVARDRGVAAPVAVADPARHLSALVPHLRGVVCVVALLGGGPPAAAVLAVGAAGEGCPLRVAMGSKVIIMVHHPPPPPCVSILHFPYKDREV